MKTESIACNNCGGPLEVAAATNFVSCQHCGSQLAVHRTESAHFTEVLSSLQVQIENLTRQNEIAALDRAWEAEKEQFMVTSEHGHRSLPTRGGSVAGGVVVAVGGIFWMVIAGGMGGGGFALFGIVFIMFGIGIAIFNYNKAEEYENAQRRYKRRRRNLQRRK